MEYSQRLGMLSDAQFQAALDRFDLGTFLHAEPISFGNFGQNVFLSSTQGDYVLRGAPHYGWQFAKERLFTDLLHERTTAPVPWPYLVDTREDIFGWAYVIMPRMPGLQLSDPHVQSGLSSADRHELARALGVTLADMHSLTWTHPGEYHPETQTIQPLRRDYCDWVLGRIHNYLNRAILASDRTTDQDVAWVKQLAEGATLALEIPPEPCFVMEDYKEGNTVAVCEEGSWRITGVFDYMEAYFGDGEADLSRLVATYADQDVALAETFVSAYVEGLAAHSLSLRPGYVERFPAYMLLDRLILWEFGQRTGVWWDADLTLQEWAERYTSLSVF